jgi:hypothetical protein
MVPIREAAMNVALGRVRWALAHPRRHGQDDWDGRLRRALTALHEAWAEHGKRADALIAAISDPDQLPFTAADRRAGDLRREHGELRREVRRLCRALRRSPSVYQSSFEFRRTGRARRSLAALMRRVRTLLDGMGQHLAAEAVWGANAAATRP